MRIYPFFVPHAGCPQRCVFCDQEQTTGRGDVTDAARLPGQLDAMLAAGGGPGEVAFYGGSFTLLERERQAALLQAARPFLSDGRICGIRLSTRPDALDAATVDFLAGQGVTTVEIGCQSFDASVLEFSGRGHGPRDAVGALWRLRRAGIRVGLQLMPGLPGGDSAEALASLDAAIELGPDFLRIYPTVVFSGTALADLRRRGDYRPWTLDEAVSVCAEMQRRCRRAGVPVIRMGVHGSPELARGGCVVDGPWHPAFGQLVRSRGWLDHLRPLLGEPACGALEVHPADLSDIVGHKRNNLTTLRGESGSLTVRPSTDIPRGRARWQGRLLPPVDGADTRSTTLV